MLKSYVTDNLSIKNNNKDFIFTQKLLNWRAVTDEQDIVFKKDLFTKEAFLHKNGYLVIHPQNYHLIYDASQIFKNREYYHCEGYLKKEIQKLNSSALEKWAKKEFFRYMQRGYLTQTVQKELSYLGLNRVEQFCTLVACDLPVKFYISDMGDFLFQKKGVFEISELSFEKKEKTDIISFLSFYEKKVGAAIALKKIIELSFKGYARGVFEKESFYILDSELKDINIKNIYDEWKEACYFTSIKISQKYILTGWLSKNDLNILKKTNKITFSAKEDSFRKIEILMRGIIPFRDLLLNIHFLIKAKKIKCYNHCLEVSDFISQRIDLREHKDWILKESWRDLYRDSVYNFENYFSPIDIQPHGFKCPLCSETKFLTTPSHIYCKNKICRFSLLRTNLKKMGIKKIPVKECVQAIRTKNVTLKLENKKIIFGELKNKESSYYIHIYNEFPCKGQESH